MPRLSLLAACLSLFVAIDAQAQRQSVTFSRRAPAEGDQAEQTITVDFQLKSTSRKGDQVFDESQTELHRDHRRVITTVEIGPAGPRVATVEYLIAEQSLNGAEANQQPVVGKTYICTREGEQLRVTTPDGEIPSMEEFKIVARNMETFGKENPLAKYFDGRSVSVGEQIELPIELAAKLLGFDSQLASAKRFTLTLRAIDDLEGRPCATFDAQIEAGSGTSGQLGLIVEGTLVMQVAGCRTVSADLIGPIGMSETKAIPGGAVHVTGVGKLRLAMRNRFKDR